MKWQASDMDTYLQAKEYVDTALIPLVPISWNKNVKGTVSWGEFISIISVEIEKQFQGRIVHFPPFTYLINEPMNQRLERVKLWEEELQAGGIKHIIYITSDGDWRQIENDLSGLHIWLPSIPLEHLEAKNRRTVISDQLTQIIPIFTKNWQGN
ncbi:YpiF family protein [Bacillus suaedae]|uniref:YpiF family protein n=1 Tax=Halalkalibacter suaedae TaxID=2822140 RepID=A0A941AMJ9_9BACI|nr:YpiF family protein [Bacillus suaedae]MBP3950605.1 YpiF family protein [Bacillus suaedae]